MSSLKDLKDQISSVKATAKITKAMQMVAAAKLRKAQEAVEAARPYKERISALMSNLVADVSSNELPRFLQPVSDAGTYLLVVFSAERGLCGGFNSNIVKKAAAQIKELQQKNKKVKLITIGKKAYDLLQYEYGSLIVEHISFRDVKKIGYENAQQIADLLLTRFDKYEFDVCLLIYAKFINILSQEPLVRSLIPFEIASESEANIANVFEYEPSLQAILNDLARHNIEVQILNVLLENIAGEMGAKITAMDNASRNASEMADKLSVCYNRRRQTKITNELIEIIAGAEAI